MATKAKIFASSSGSARVSERVSLERAANPGLGSCEGYSLGDGGEEENAAMTGM